MTESVKLSGFGQQLASAMKGSGDPVAQKQADEAMNRIAADKARRIAAKELKKNGGAPAPVQKPEVRAGGRKTAQKRRPPMIATTVIVAAAENGVIGAGKVIPWKLPSDLKFFKAVTMGSPIIMGRKTFESIGGPLPGRAVIVVSKRVKEIEGVRVAATLSDAIRIGRGIARKGKQRRLFICGGGRVYKQCLKGSLVDEVILTRVAGEAKGNVHFDLKQFEGNEDWIVEQVQDVPRHEKDDREYEVQRYWRKSSKIKKALVLVAKAPAEKEVTAA